MNQDHSNEIIQFMMQRQKIEYGNREEHMQQFPNFFPEHYYEGFKEGYEKCLSHMRDYLVYLKMEEKNEVV